jgi:hypothetical protein
MRASPCPLRAAPVHRVDAHRLIAPLHPHPRPQAAGRHRLGLRDPMAKLTAERLRALLLLARNPNGCTEAMMMAHGFTTEMLEEFVTTGLAKASPEQMKIARRQRKVICFQITDLGRKAAADN